MIKTHVHKRKLANYLIKPRFQLKYSFQFLIGFLVFVSAVQAFMIWRMNFFINDFALHFPYQSGYQLQLSEMLNHLILSTTVSIVVAGVAIFLVAISLSHKIAGPAYVIQTALENMIQEKYDVRPHLRKGDELADVYEALARLAQKHRGEEET